VKPLDLVDKLYLIAQDELPPFVLQLVVEFGGSLPAEELRQAVRRATRACPGVKLRLEKRGGCWRWTESEAEIAVREDSTPASELLEGSAIQRPLDSRGSAACEVLLTGGASQLVFRANHGIMDARGLFLWAKAVIGALRGEETTESVLAFPPRSPVTGEKGFHARLTPDQEPVPGAKAARASGAIRLRHARFTVNHRFPSVLPHVMLALHELRGGSAKSRFMIPTDLRPLTPDAAPVSGNHSRPIFFEVESGDSAPKLQDSLIRKLLAEEQLRLFPYESFFSRVPVGLTRILSGALAHLQERRGKYLVAAILSNVGKIRLQDFAWNGHRPHAAYFIPVAGPGTALNLAFLQCDQNTEVVATSPLYSAAGLRTLLQQLLGERHV
jgi:hypothetical protein